MIQPRMFYFGPWNGPGHYFHNERGSTVWEEEILGFPFGHMHGRLPVDGCLQPGCKQDRRDGRWSHQDANQVEGEALIHHVDGWTALSLWDRSVDKRGACNSTYFAEGTFTFAEMVEMSKTRFAYSLEQDAIRGG